MNLNFLTLEEGVLSGRRRSFDLYVPGTPQAQPRSRPRFHGRGYFVPRTDWFDAFQRRARIYAVNQHLHKQPFVKAVRVVVHFFFPKPKPKKKSDAPKHYHDVRPDIDNLVKGLLDALTHAGWWKSDAIVAELSAYKSYSEDPGTQLVVESVIDEDIKSLNTGLISTKVFSSNKPK